ncbi:MAG: TolC family protein [Armatimonadetes bacterium]|nr:TolC family protein [Armatimonadota bacterium]
MRFKRWSLWVLGLLALGSCVLAEDAAPGPMTLEDSILTAYRNNPGLKIATERAARAHAAVGEAAAGRMPQIGATGTYTRFDEKVSFGGATVRKSDAKSLGLQVTQPIDISRLVRTSEDIARLSAAMSDLDVHRARQQLALDVRSAYFNVLRAARFVRVAQDSVARSEEVLRVTEAQYRAETVPRFDVIRAEVQLANVRQQLIQAQNGLSLAQAAFNNTLGVDQKAPVALEEVSGTAEPAPELDPTVQTAYERRPEVIQIETNIKIARKGITLAKRGLKPSLAVVWGGTYNPDTTIFAPKSFSWTAVASLNFPLYDGGATRSRARQAEQDIAIAETTLDQLRQGISLEVRQALLNVNEARDRIGVAEKGVDQAKEGLRLARVRYEAGVGTALEVTDAQVALTQAENNYVNAVYDYRTARARLLKAVGSE